MSVERRTVLNGECRFIVDDVVIVIKCHTGSCQCFHSFCHFMKMNRNWIRLFRITTWPGHMNRFSSVFLCFLSVVNDDETKSRLPTSFTNKMHSHGKRKRDCDLISCACLVVVNVRCWWKSNSTFQSRQGNGFYCFSRQLSMRSNNSKIYALQRSLIFWWAHFPMTTCNRIREKFTKLNDALPFCDLHSFELARLCFRVCVCVCLCLNRIKNHINHYLH